ncbi:serine-rich family protein [Mycobacteroides abscessus]|uniref:hypothetical protein n=1 Tax=Mycobacteroides abscessus TaxID=36809 RepID=UPI000927E1FD|nr:hypothetical protein [Mycobacteroides abscessus]SHT05822.1 bacteriophage protein [Mycobacteroides abscessus subsp. abscessus]SHX46515.1 bacteriophage protein [Mycobacteroides abscessus subsp. abscessus]SKG05540.1 bacteriophage protein [Mycobacteroides abscessus subsp. abscessus]SKG20457.1 bacteriophage protein [Mycobacteroides abscessus subsp. abscessus]SKG79452.1 bacteriophage protein [Mycobacteroides abscessus subsp. abscessus]
MAGITGWWAEIIIEPEPAVITITGGVPDVVITKDVFIEPTPAVLTLTGSRPSLEQTVHPAPAVLTLTGGVPNISTGHTVTPTAASLTLTGGTPAVTLTDNKLINPTAAALTLTGGTPTVAVLSPISIDQVGTPGSENTGNLTCSINPTSGADVLVFAWCIDAASSCYQATYSGNPMRFLGRAKLNGGSLSVFLVENMSSGSATVTVNKSGSGWAQAAAVTYTGAVDFRQARIALGAGTSVSQSASPGLSSRSIQSFCRGGNNGTFGSLSGGTNRVNETSGFVAGTVSDTSTSAAFSGTLSTSANWGSVVIDALPHAITTPKINYTSGVWSESNGGTQTFTVKAASNDYIVVDMVQAASGDPSSVTCAGTAMTLIDTQTWSHPSTGSGFLKRYRSGQLSSGDKTISITATGSQWWHAAGMSISGVTSFGATTKTSGTSSAPSQSVTCSPGQLVLQSFATGAAATDINATNYHDSPGGSLVFLYQNVSLESATIAATGSTNWAGMATVIS